MAEPFLAEIRIVGFNFAPHGWAFCDGQILPISQNQALYSLVGTTYGGDGMTTYALPDLRGRAAVHEHTGVQGFQQGQRYGVETVTLTADELPAHNHPMQATENAATDNAPSTSNTSILAEATVPSHLDPVYVSYESASSTSLADSTISHTGGGQAHNNMQPYITLSFCIALTGTFPARN